MTLSVQELDKIRLHIGIYSGYRRIEKDRRSALVGSRRRGDRMRPLPGYRQEIRRAGMAFKYLSSPLLHDLNSMVMMLNTWDEHLHPVPTKALREKIQAMEEWIVNHGGKA